MSSARPGETPGPLNVRGKITTVGPDAEIRSKGPLTVETTASVSTSLTLGTGAGAVTLTPQPGTINSLLLNGQILSAHDALYAFAPSMISNGTALDQDGAASAGMPRWSLANAATQRVKWMFEVPAEWDTVAVRFLWCKDAAGAQAVTLAFRYHLFYPFATEDLDAGAMTSIDLSGLGTDMSVAHRPKYEIPAGTSAIAVADGFIGSKPFMLCEIERDGTGDAFAGAVSIAAATLTRTA